MFSRIAAVLAAAAVPLSGIGLHTAQRAEHRMAIAAERITRDAAVAPLPPAAWEHDFDPWLVAARECDPEAASMLHVWRVIVQDKHTDEFWQARMAYETTGCNKPKVMYTGYDG